MKRRQTIFGILFLMCFGAGTGFAADRLSTVDEQVAQTQTPPLTGIVKSADGQYVSGASVVVKGTTNGTVVENNGQFYLNGVEPGAVIQISFLGFKTQEIKWNGHPLNVILEEDAQTLDQVVVVGYGTQKKANLTGAVSTVDVSKTMDGRAQANVGKALQGVVPGLTIINNSGQLNAAPTITIRGTGTLSNSATSNPLIVVDGVVMEDISYLNPNDIESISVLKDAASTSIYGTRAAFGVLLIQTKSAHKIDRVTVNYSNNFAWDTPTMMPDYPTVAEQARGLRAANERMGVENELFGMYMDDSFIAKADAWLQRHGGKKAGYREMIPGDDFDLNPDNGSGLYYADWDVVGIMFRKWKFDQTHNLSVQGTSGRTNYYLSLGYNEQNGVFTFHPDHLQRYNVNMNVNSDITKWLTVGARFSYTDRVYNKANSRRDNYTYIWRWGSFFGPYGTYNGYDMYNDIAYLKQAGDRRTNYSYTRMGGFLKAKIVKGLTLNADYTHNIRNVMQKADGLPVQSLNSWGGDVRTPSWRSAQSASYVYQESTLDHSWALNIFGNYEFSANNHNLNVMVGFNAEAGELKYHWSQRQGLLDSTLPEFSLATGAQTVGGAHSHWSTAGWFGRINYDYNGIWLLELNGRFDGSSKFPSSSRWAFFPSGSFGYRFSEESYFDNIRDIVSNGKIRASYGEIGNQAIGNNMFISTIASRTAASTYWVGSGSEKVSAYDLPSLVSATLSWERISTIDVGLDFGLFNEVNVSFDWYQRDTKDMLAPAKVLPAVLGASAPYENAGSLRTRGWELNIDWAHSFANGLSVYANANIGDFKTTITKWENDAKLLNQNYNGKVYGDIWGFETDRLFTYDDFNADGSYKSGVASQKGLEQNGFVFGPGDIKFKDLNGDGVIDGGSGTADDHGDLKVIGNTTPRYQYSFRVGASWKGFDIDAYFQGVGKRDYWSTGAFVLPMSRGADAIYSHQTDYWSESNPDFNAFYPRMWAGNTSTGTISVLNGGNHNFYPQTRYLVNMAYLRFKNLTVGYTLPQTLTRKAYIDKVRVYFSADNLCELVNKSKYPIDPEVNASESSTHANGVWGRIDPMYRTLSFGVQVTF